MGHPRSLLWAEVSSNLHCPCLHRFQVHVPALAGLSCTRKCKCWDALSALLRCRGPWWGRIWDQLGLRPSRCWVTSWWSWRSLLAATQFIVEEKYLAK